MSKIEDLIGLTFVSVESKQDQELVFTTDTGRVFRFYHRDDCCESVTIESIVGDLADLCGSPLLKAEESCSSEAHPDGYTPSYEYESYTWTFYKFATIKGYVDVRWLGTSNGYYSEAVDLEEVPA